MERGSFEIWRFGCGVARLLKESPNFVKIGMKRK
jgi:hypothetical protein